MKTLSKLAQGRQTIPVLNTVRVLNGRALSTDLDIWIEDAAPGLEDGLYHAHGFEAGMRIKSDISMDDFPGEYSKRGDFVGDINLQADFILDQFAWVAMAMSTEQVRYYLNGIAFHDNKIIATDGHRLHQASIAAPFPIDSSYSMGMILPAKAVKVLISLVKEKKHKGTVNISFYKYGFVFEIGSALVISKRVDGTSPDYQRVIPTIFQGETVFDPLEYKAALKEAKVLGKIHGRRSLPVRISCHNKIHIVIGEGRDLPTKTNISAEYCREGIGFSLPYMVDLCAGVMRYNGPSEPVRIDGDGGKVAVLMPLRV